MPSSRDRLCRPIFAQVVLRSCAIASATFSSAVPGLLEASPDWTRDARTPPEGRANILELPPDVWGEAVEMGRRHALAYPVEVTGALFPYVPLLNILDAESREPNPLRWLLRKVGGGVAGLRSFSDVERLVGVVPYPDVNDRDVYQVPRPVMARERVGMGTTILAHDDAMGLTWSCGACHAGRLFGKTVLGLTNRFPKANDFFLLGQSMTQSVSPWMFANVTRATPEETRMYERLQKSIRFIGARAPLVEGLDTSLAQVGLSLSRRGADPEATRDDAFARNPAPNMLEDAPADSKPAVWWNVKYKTRWLSDGSVVSGNPIYTNILWNEVGRGADLREVEGWLNDNPGAVDELTAAVFAARAPRWTDFFAPETIDLATAKQGEALFNGNCARCHGTYEKSWSRADAHHLPPDERLRTMRVRYHERTPVIDVGTDLHRARGMEGLAEGLNRLSISRSNGVVVEVQAGYVPPPLEGIWARWPYFHNNSVPTLCAVLTRSSERPRVFHAGEAVDKERDFDGDCVGYPTGAATPKSWQRNASRRVDTSRRGLGNQGHDEGVFLDGGREMYTPEQKRALVEFLKTL